MTQAEYGRVLASVHVAEGTNGYADATILR